MIGRRSMVAVVGWLVVLVLVRALVASPERCDASDPTELRASAQAALGWLKEASRPDGRYVYVYDRETNALPSDYNEVRHAGVTMSLYQGAGRFDDAEALAAADAGLGWMVDRLIVGPEGWRALPGLDGSRATLGSSALMLAGLVERRRVTGDGQYDELMRDLGRLMAAMQRPDGSFNVVWDVGSGQPDPEVRSKYSPGEAFWALTLLHETFPGEGWDAPARAAAHYLATRRDEDDGISFPPWADQWAAYGLGEMADWGLGDEEIAYARSLAGRFGLFTRSEAQWEGGGVAALVRSGPARAAGAGTWIEGMAALWRLGEDPRLADLRPAIAERLSCLCDIMTDRQATAGDASGHAHPELVIGAWFGEGGETRMDDQQHALSGLMAAADVLEGEYRE